METKKIKRAWYRIVANGLLSKLAYREECYQTLLDEYVELNSELQAGKTDLEDQRRVNSELLQRQGIENSDAAVAVQVIRERMRFRETLPPHLDSARSHGMRQRNTELIRENEQLKRVLREHGNH